MKKSLICFLHIEKAAGTTLHHILANNFKNYLTISPAYYWSNEPGNYVSPNELKWIMKFTLSTEAIGGHPLRSYLQYEDKLNRSVKYITFLREPVARYLSHYKHQKYAKGIHWNIHSFLQESRFNDYMTRRLSSSNNLNEAKAVLSDQMAFVGITERFDESLFLLKKECFTSNFDLRYEKENVGINDISNDIFINDANIYNRIIENNRNDIELYNYAIKSIYNRFLDSYGPSLDNDIRQFKKQNKGFSFSKFKKLKNRLYRVSYYKPLQNIIKILFH